MAWQAVMIQKLLKVGFKVTERIAPSLASKWATRLFLSPMRYPRPEREEVWLKTATIQRVAFISDYQLVSDANQYTLYQWGAGPVVLLLHGWAGRGSQMAAFAQPLVEAGYRVIAFDAPAHGASPGKRTNMVEITQIVQDIQDREGPFAAMIGHSFGGMVGANALNESVQADKLITIGSPASMAYIFASFTSHTGASEISINGIKRLMKQLTNKTSDDFSLVNLVQTIQQPGLIIHDKQDKEVTYTEAFQVSEHWLNSQLILTEGLGHQRILRDPELINTIVSYIKRSEPEATYA